ncbi:MAG: 50S ribosomal protein L10 [Candidatus Falkowbacteria bacterium GW2011_GWC2_38_22]|uniref:Large ribosomal subunit protein uL10 n=1 Tax=Candidatus Falkowbacteria bacterium GW2011_GWE1_38_31 TaxID=1618638 RepID=A0A0G0K6B7_9BACT|nr:MAG: 50S ribosomal protein L10 [Candidatus Falkowbacteria bacterium GW2011_GWF2_38_1205]KKQ62175.1 MAG: 50S ribosomal protein L10 [Candidatus Falkowbacteria bacterium GW2011_GWC2_38_22]KKQ64325.1 MAG: 50S ribosomal protein L10 [Candidatus Falkowbacteria bacterium GW2011_GWF1_38_22]KKQ66302.1 MAG: 50S ribosomal protein L10 [Candidatus Falkowbacteria bacterium GW2011_GWE2_38_254]KKQ71030.1 MAG: 50S ribosomal protein L10 [Candidatus Falkowbacteria bacterium GW2011_GWE1_38_31]KKQ73539.1 MAG: 50
MPKTKLQKQEILRTIEEKIKKSKSIVFAKFDALGVKDNEALRSNLKKSDSEYLVAKKTLLDIAFKDKGIENLEIKNFEGKVAAIFAYGDEVAPAKTVHDFKKGKEEKIDFVGGILENKFLSKEQVSALALLPSKNELYAKMVGSLNAPISGFVNVLAGNLRKFVYVLKAIEEKKF